MDRKNVNSSNSMKISVTPPHRRKKKKIKMKFYAIWN